jgi:phosphoribosyl-ATP pyrophosphohydrolase
MNNVNNNVFEELESVVLGRKENMTEGSYTCYLFEQGVDKILKKCGEECSEMIIAAKNNDNVELKNEISDLLYHIMVLCANQGLPFAEVMGILDERAKKVGNLKKFKTTDKNS